MWRLLTFLVLRLPLGWLESTVPPLVLLLAATSAPSGVANDSLPLPMGSCGTATGGTDEAARERGQPIARRQPLPLMALGDGQNPDRKTKAAVPLFRKRISTVKVSDIRERPFF